MKIIHHEKGKDLLYKTWHSGLENMIIYIHSDCGGSLVFQDKIYPMQKGTLCFIGSGKQHYTLPENSEIYDRSKIFVTNEVLSNLLKIFTKEDDFSQFFSSTSVVYAQIPPETIKKIDHIFKEANDTLKANKTFPERFLSYYFLLMSYIKEYETEKIIPQDNFISKALDYINKEYSNLISLEDICKKIHISKYYFCREFKKALGITVMEYVLKTRIATAKDMLRFEKTPIERISEKCGFSSISFFCQAFKKDTGMTANQYRKAFSKEFNTQKSKHNK